MDRIDAVLGMDVHVASFGDIKVNEAWSTIRKALEEGRKPTDNKHMVAKAQISAFVEMVASLSKTEYAAHEQLVSIINQVQKLHHA